MVRRDFMPNHISCDPGASCGLVLWEDRVPVAAELVKLDTIKGAMRLVELFKEWVPACTVGHLIIENQYPRPGRSFKSVFGIAAYRGAVECQARFWRMTGKRIQRIKPDEWKRPVLKRMGSKWIDKDAALHRYAVELAHRFDLRLPAAPDAEDALVMGHVILNRGLYV